MMITGAPELSQASNSRATGSSTISPSPRRPPILRHRFAGRASDWGRPDHEGGAGLCGIRPSVSGEILRTLRQAAAHREAPVLLLGETGTGKDLAARRLHQMTFGADAEKMPYVAINCSAVPAEMFESELFGSERVPTPGGSTTGRIDRSRPRRNAFLDEVGEIPSPPGQTARFPGEPRIPDARVHSAAAVYRTRRRRHQSIPGGGAPDDSGRTCGSGSTSRA